MTFSKETKLQIVEAQNHKCLLCSDPIVDIHHKLYNTKPNNKLYPIFVNSILNAVGLCFSCHTHRKHELNIPYKIAGAYEKYLRELKGEK